MSNAHEPFTDDGVTYCGWDGHKGCGEVWPCSTARRKAEIAYDLMDLTEQEFPTEWVHCSPTLLVWVNCAATPRRACECEIQGSHDHLVDQSWLVGVRAPLID